MHRSGTSALTRTINLLGAAAPQTLLAASASNERGHWESEPIVRLNDEILAACGHAWFSRGRMRVDPAAVTRANGLWDRLRATLDSEFGDASTVVLKDPRISRLVPLYREALQQAGYEVVSVLTLRNPLEVAQSIATRDRLSVERALETWLRYTLDAERATRGTVRALVAYEALLADWRGCTARMKAQLGGEWFAVTPEMASEIDAFLSPGLRHHTLDLPAAGFGRAAVAGRLYRDMVGRLSDHPSAVPGGLATGLAKACLALR
ncbi:sulfotransferase family protein [Ancylobacter dichloromethanicus]|nr:sulfotransferase family protein [Ancylobacter dichloromethanicus]MBS7554198.1 sulfotransferase family protein [Ancylobacter dichloromethanicus]